MIIFRSFVYICRFRLYEVYRFLPWVGNTDICTSENPLAKNTNSEARKRFYDHRFLGLQTPPDESKTDWLIDALFASGYLTES